MKRSKNESRKRIHLRIRKKVSGTPENPRLSVYRSNKSIYCQIIDDISGRTIVAATTKEITEKGTKVEQSNALGKLLAEKAAKVGITQVKFDRGGYLYHGRVKAVAEGAREGGLQF